MKHKGIIFDMDGTLWDSAENVAKSWNKAIAKIMAMRGHLSQKKICIQ